MFVSMDIEGIDGRVDEGVLGREFPGTETADGVLTIDCDACVMQGTDVCADCVVSLICSSEPDEAVVIDVAEIRALRMLGEAGLVPRLRHARRTG